jgi:hypothetical protein
VIRKILIVPDYGAGRRNEPPRRQDAKERRRKGRSESKGYSFFRRRGRKERMFTTESQRTQRGKREKTLFRTVFRSLLFLSVSSVTLW